MAIPRVSTSARLGAGLARATRHLQNDPNIDAACVDLGTNFGGTWRGLKTPAAIDAPTYAVFKTDNRMIVTVLGAQYLEIIARFVQSCNLRPAPTQGLNQLWGPRLAAERFWPTLDFFGIAGMQHVIFSGHSYGGCVAASLASIYNFLFVDRDPWIITFGSPRGSYDRGESALTGVRYVRWNRLLDPVPFMPPHAGEAPTMRNFAPATWTTNWSATNHAGQGITIAELGNTIMQELPNQAPNITEANLSGFIRTNDSVGAFAHAISSYEQDLEFIARFEAEDRPPPRNVLPVPQPLPNPIANDPNIPHDDGTVPHEQLEGFRLAVTNNPRRRVYYAKKVGRTHGVYSGDQFIAACKGSKSARNLARSLNTALNRWNATRYGDEVAFQQSVIDNFAGGV